MVQQSITVGSDELARWKKVHNPVLENENDKIKELDRSLTGSGVFQ